MTSPMLRAAIAGLAHLLVVLPALAADAAAVPAASGRFGRLEPLPVDARAWPSAPLRWMNLEPRSPYALDGEPLVAHPRTGMSGVSLQAGQSTHLRLPAGAWLRLHDPDRGLCPGEYEVAVGDGSGLYAAQVPVKPDDIHSLLWDDRLGEERVVRITRLRACGGARHVALYRSDTAGIEPDLAYRERIRLGAQTVDARGRDDAQHLEFELLRAGAFQVLELEGPLQLAVQTRRVYPGVRAPDNVDRYRLRWRERVGEAPTADCSGADAAACARLPVWRELRFDTTPELQDPQSLDGCLLPTGRLETRYIEIPEGRRRFVIESSADVLVRLSSGSGAEFLLPSFNRPRAPGAAAASAAARIDAADAMRLDNTRREGALHAAQDLMDTAAQDEAGRALREAGRQTWHRHTYYRSVLPYRGGAAQDPSLAWIMSDELGALLDPGRRRTVQPRQFEALVKALDEAWFLPLSTPPDTVPARPQREACCAASSEARSLKLSQSAADLATARRAAEEAGTRRAELRGASPALALTPSWRRETLPNEAALQDYWLPERGVDSRLRLLADLGATPVARTLWLQYDAAAPVRIQVAPPAAPMQAGSAESALRLLQDAAGPLDRARFWGRLADGRGTAPLLRPAQVELPLAAGVRRVRVWSQDTPPADFRVALQYRTAKPFELVGDDYQRVLDTARDPRPFDAFLAALRAAAPAGAPGATAVPAFAIDAAVFDDREAARVEAARLRAQGLSTQLLLDVTADRRERHRVRLGPFARRDEAEAARARLGLASAQVVDLSPDPDSAVHAVVANLPAERAEEAQLLQHWVPLLRLLSDRVARFAAPVRGEGPSAAVAGRSAVAVLSQARADEAAGRWLNALEAYSSARRSGSAEERRQALDGQTRSLRALGEPAVADHQMRAAALHGDDPALRQWARAQLRADYLAGGDDAAEQGLLAAALLREGQPADAALLVQALQDAGESRHALSLGLLLAPCVRPRESLLQAAYELRQWEVFERLLAQSPDDRRALWQGRRAQLSGDDARALQLWRTAGDEGRAAAESLRTGQDIADGLHSAGMAARSTAAARWFEWAAQEPGPRRWRFAPELVVAHAGVRSQEALARDLLVTAFEAAPGRPVRIQAFGPGTLRLEARPLAAAGAGEAALPYDGWIEVEQRHDGRLQRRVLPVVHNTPVAGFVQLAPGQAAVGQAEDFLLDLAPGLNEIAVSAQDRALLVRPSRHEPVAPLVVLPRPAPQALAWALRTADADRASRPTGPLRVAQGCTAFPSSGLGRDRIGAIGAEHGRQAGNRVENAMAACEGLPAAPASGLRLPRPADLDADAAGDPDAELIRLLWRAERASPPEAAALSAQAESLARERAGRPVADAVQARLRGRGEWERIVSSRRDAGQRRIVEAAGASHSPQSRGRQALVPSLAAGEQLLRAGETVTVELAGSPGAVLEADLVAQELPNAVPAPMTVAVTPANAGTRRVALGGDAPGRARIDLPLGAGPASVAFAVEAAYANQFVRIALRERGPGGTRALAVESEREYFLATAARPLELELAGPAWLRVDERRGERLLTSYRYVGAGAQTVRIAPDAAQAEAQYRVYRRRPRSDDAPPAPVRASPVRVAGPWSAAPAPVIVAPLHIGDAYPLSAWLGQEDATYSLRLAPTFRRSGDEGRGEVGERFVELGLARRRYDEVREQYWHSELALRERDRGEPVLGLRQWIEYAPQRRPWSLGVFGSLYTQALDEADRRATSGLLRADGAWRERFGDVLRNDTRIGLFHHLLDGDAQRHPAAETDRDITSRYKRQHRRGLTLADRLTWIPWRDTELYGEAGLGSNEDHDPFDPDYLRVGLGARQKLGACAVEGDYRLRQFRADADRADTLYLDYLDFGVDCDTWTRRAAWAGAGHRWSARLSATQELASGDTGWLLSLGVDFNNGRGYRDFRPGEIDFRALRARDLADAFPNNLLGTEPP